VVRVRRGAAEMGFVGFVSATAYAAAVRDAPPGVSSPTSSAALERILQV
jgi:hypothetical protein